MSIALVPASRARSRVKVGLFGLLGLATVFVLYMKNSRIADPTSEIAQHFAPVMGYLAAHAFFGMLALLLGVFQFSSRLRARYLKVHRSLGYAYVASVFISAPFAVPVAMKTGTPSLTAASCVQSLGWMVTTAIALFCVKRGNIVQHRRWMIRSYPFAMIFTVARLLIPIPPIFRLGMTGIEMVVWVTIAMAGFLPSIFLDWRAITERPAEA